MKEHHHPLQIALCSNEVGLRQKCPFRKIIYYMYFGVDPDVDLLTSWQNEKRYASFKLGLTGSEDNGLQTDKHRKLNP